MPELTESQFLSELRALGVFRFARVLFRANRSRLLSISKDGFTLYVHDAYRTATPEVLDAIRDLYQIPTVKRRQKKAAALLRNWPPAVEGIRQTRAQKPRRKRRPPRCCGTPEQQQFLRALYMELNLERFEECLPLDVSLRFSNRMRRTLGSIRYGVIPTATELFARLRSPWISYLPAMRRNLSIRCFTRWLTLQPGSFTASRAMEQHGRNGQLGWVVSPGHARALPF